ncbi:MAG: hypothetical protein HY904_01410 [Deltaproteobacteria bacterium]|nr:hypothetical protein [Deltaproteobacteria bacterium]
MMNPRRLLVPSLVGLALVGCECNRDVLGLIPDAGNPPPEDAGHDPPPPEFPLKPGDNLRYAVNNVTYCNETLEPMAECQGITEQSVVWNSEYTVKAPGATLDDSSNSWKVSAEYYWEVADKKGDDGTAFQSLSKLWFTKYGPWDQQLGARLNPAAVRSFDTTEAFTAAPTATSYPFFDFTKWDLAANRFQEFVRTLDSEPDFDVSQAERKMRAGFLEPSEPTYLHVVQLYYHPLGFVCQVSESIGPWRQGAQKDASGFLDNKIIFKSDVSAPRLTRVGQTMKVCKCSPLSAGNSDCT